MLRLQLPLIKKGIKLLKVSCNVEREKVIIQYEDLIFKIAHKYRPSILDLEFDDIVQELKLHLWCRLKSFDSDRASLITFINVVLENKCKNLSEKSKKIKENVEEGDFIEEYLLDNIIDYAPNEKVAIETAYHVAELHKEKEVILRLLQGEKQVEVAVDFKVSRQRISKIWNDYIDEVKKEL